MKHLFVTLLLICLAAAWACADEPEPEPEPAAATPQQVAQTTQGSPPTAQPEPATPSSTPTTQPERPTQGSASSGQSGQSSSASSDDDDDDSEDDDNGDSGEHHSKKDSDDDATVSNVNPGLVGTAFDSSRNDALFDAEPLDAVTWSMEPTISPGALEAAGTLSGGAMLFDPTVDGEGASFAVYYKDHNEPMVLLLPNLGPMYIWDTNHTVAEMDYEFEGSSFTIRAYSPLFMDVGPDDLVIRVFGTDGDGNDALLAVAPVGTQ